MTVATTAMPTKATTSPMRRQRYRCAVRAGRHRAGTTAARPPATPARRRSAPAGPAPPPPRASRRCSRPRRPGRAAGAGRDAGGSGPDASGRVGLRSSAQVRTSTPLWTSAPPPRRNATPHHAGPAQRVDAALARRAPATGAAARSRTSAASSKRSAPARASMRSASGAEQQRRLGGEARARRVARAGGRRRRRCRRCTGRSATPELGRRARRVRARAAWPATAGRCSAAAAPRVIIASATSRGAVGRRQRAEVEAAVVARAPARPRGGGTPRRA